MNILNNARKFVSSFLIFVLIVANFYAINLICPKFNKIRNMVSTNYNDNNFQLDEFKSYLKRNEIEIIGLNILGWSNNPSNSYLFEQLALDWSSEITIINKKEDLFKHLSSGKYDALLLISCDDIGNEILEFNTIQLEEISEFVERGGILICSDHIIELNPSLCRLVGVNQFQYTPYLPDMFISSEHYLVNPYMNYTSEIGGDGFLITQSENSIILAKHHVWKPPIIHINKYSNISEVSSGKDIRIFLEITNLGKETAYNINIEEYLNSFLFLKSNFNSTIMGNKVFCSIENLKANESKQIFLDCKAPPVDFIQEFELQTKIEYYDVKGRKYLYPDLTLFNYYELSIVPPIVSIEVSLANVLAWYDDISDIYFINEVLDDRCYYSLVNNIQDLLDNLKNNNYDVLWLMNFGWIDYPEDLTFESFCDWINETIRFYKEFNETCAETINNWVRMGGKIICSDWTLNNYQKGISDIFGVEKLCGIPPIFFDIETEWEYDNFNYDHDWEWVSAGITWYTEGIIEWDWYHKIGINVDHPITSEFLDSVLKSKSWAFELQFYPEYCENLEIPETIAYYYKPLGCYGEVLDLESPAIITSNYENGQGVYFSMDIGRSSFKGYNTSVWIQLAINSMKWLSFWDDSSKIAVNLEYNTPDPYLCQEFTHLVLNQELPSIILNHYGFGRAIYFTFDIGLQTLSQIDNDLWIDLIRNSCYRMIQFESTKEYVIDNENLEVCFYFTAIGESILSVITEDIEPLEGKILIDGKEIKDLDPYLNFTDIYCNFTTLNHEIRIIGNIDVEYFNGFKLKSICIQKICLFYQDYGSPRNDLKINFKGSGYFKLIVNCIGNTISVLLDNIFLCENISIAANEPQFSLNFNAESNLHCLRITGENLLIKNFTVISEVDCDGDEISSGDELLLKSSIFQQNNWMFWESLYRTFSISESKQAGINLKYVYHGKIFIVIPSSFNDSELYLKMNDISLKDYIKDVKIIDIQIYDNIVSPGNYLLEEHMESGTYTITFDFVEQYGDGFFDIELYLKKDGEIYEPLIIENSIYSDSDGDGIGDANEIYQELDPYNPDSDGDYLFDGLDYSKKNFDILQGSSLHKYIFNLSEELITQNLRIDLQIQRPMGDTLYERTGLTWIDGGTIDIVPLLRIIGPYFCEGLEGDYLPNDLVDNTSNYIALVPFVEITDYSYQTMFTYYSNHTDIHPAFEDLKLELTFDLVWGALHTNTTGGKQMLHIWPHPEDLIIQGLDLYHFSKLTGVLLRVLSTEEQDQIYATYILESQWGWETEHLVGDIPDYLNGGIRYFDNVNPGQLKSVLFSKVDTIPDFSDDDFFVLVTEFNKTISTDGLVSKFIGKLIFRVVKTTIGLIINKVSDYIKAKEFTFGMSYGFKLAKEEIINKISVTAIFEKNELDQWVLTFNKQSSTSISIIDGTWSYRGSRTSFPSDGGLDIIETRIYVNPETEQYQIVEYFRHVDADGNIVYRDQRIKQDWVDIPEEQIYDLDDTLDEPLKKVTWLQKGLQIFNIIMSIYTIITSIMAIVEAAQIFSIGIELINLGGDFYWPGVAITIGAILIIISSIISITMAVIDIVLAGLILAGVLSTNPISIWAGLAIFAVSLIILLIGWLLIIFGQNNIPDYDTPSLRMVTTGKKAPKILFSTKALNDILFRLSPEIGCGITLSYYFYVYDDPEIDDEAYIQEHEAILTFGDDSWGSHNPETSYWNDKVFGIGYPSQKVTVMDTCTTWGPRIDAILRIKYQFYNDGINGRAYYYIPLDLDLPIYPDNVQDFIDYLEGSNLYSRTKEAVTIHINTDGEMDYEGVGDKKYAQVGPTSNGPWYSLYAANDPWSRPGYIKTDSGAKDAWQAGFLPENKVGYVRIYNEETNDDNNYDDWMFDKAAFSWNGNDWEWDTCIIRDYYKDILGRVYYEERTVDFFDFGDNLGLYCILDTHPTQILYKVARTDGFTLIRHANGKFYWYHY